MAKRELAALKDANGTHQLELCPSCNFFVRVEDMLYDEGVGEKKNPVRCVFCETRELLFSRSSLGL